jgi:hypothetical protein
MMATGGASSSGRSPPPLARRLARDRHAGSYQQPDEPTMRERPRPLPFLRAEPGILGQRSGGNSKTRRYFGGPGPPALSYAAVVLPRLLHDGAHRLFGRVLIAGEEGIGRPQGSRVRRQPVTTSDDGCGRLAGPPSVRYAPLLPSIAPTLPAPEPALGRRERPSGDPRPVLGQLASHVDEPVLGAQVDAVKGE